MPSAYAPILRKIGQMVTARGLAFELNDNSEFDSPQLVAGQYEGFLEHNVYGPSGHIYLTQRLSIEVSEEQANDYDIEMAVKRMAASVQLHYSVDELVERAFAQALEKAQKSLKRLSVRTSITKLDGWYAQNGDEDDATMINFEIKPDGKLETLRTPPFNLDTDYVKAFTTLLDLVCAQPPKVVAEQPVTP